MSEQMERQVRTGVTQIHRAFLQNTCVLQSSSPAERPGRPHLNQVFRVKFIRLGTSWVTDRCSENTALWHLFWDIPAKETHPESNHKGRVNPNWGTFHKNHWIIIIKHQGHETQTQSKELTQTAGGMGTRRRTWSRAGPCCPRATAGPAGWGNGPAGRRAGSSFWWSYCGDTTNVCLREAYSQEFGGDGIRFTTYSQLMEGKKLFALETSISLWFFQHKNYTKNLSSIVNAHHQKCIKWDRKLK